MMTPKGPGGGVLGDSSPDTGLGCLNSEGGGALVALPCKLGEGSSCSAPEPLLGLAELVVG